MIYTEDIQRDKTIFKQLQNLSSSFRQWRNLQNYSGGFVEATTDRGRTYEQQVRDIFSRWAVDDDCIKILTGSFSEKIGQDEWICRENDQIRLYHKNRLTYEVDGLILYNDLLVFMEVSMSRQPSYYRNLKEKIPGKRAALEKIFPRSSVGCLVITRPGMRTIPYRSVSGTICLTLPFTDI